MAYAMAAMAAVQLASSYFAAQNARDTAELNNDVAQWNAEFAELDAHDAIIEGESSVARYEAVVDQTLGDQRVAFAVADVDATYGSASEISKETKFMAEINRMEIEKQAQEKALGYKRQARDFRLQAGLNLAAEEARASSIQASGVVGALGTLSKADFTGYGPKRSSGGQNQGLDNFRNNEVTGYQSLTGDF
jgi:hypothetical protein